MTIPPIPKLCQKVWLTLICAFSWWPYLASSIEIPTSTKLPAVSYCCHWVSFGAFPSLVFWFAHLFWPAQWDLLRLSHKPSRFVTPSKESPWKKKLVGGEAFLPAAFPTQWAYGCDGVHTYFPCLRFESQTAILAQFGKDPFHISLPFGCAVAGAAF